MARAGGGERLVFIDLRDVEAPRSFTADEFDASIAAFASGLSSRGIGPGQRVGILSANRWEMLAAYLGTMTIGAVSVPINIKFARETIEHVISDAGIDLLFCDAERLRVAPADLQTVCFDDKGFDAFTRETGAVPAYEPAEADLAEILYTSGSTGLPKGVPLNHAGQLWALTKYLAPVAGDVATDRNLVVAPLYHMNALFYSTLSLANAMTIVSLPAFDARRYLDAVIRYECTYLSGVPTMFALLAALGDDAVSTDLSFVRHIGIGSAPLSESLLRQIHEMFPNASVSNGYGTTEAGPSVFGAHPDGIPTPAMSIGYPLPDIEWRLADGADGQEGVLEVRTGALATGYLNRPEADRERFRDGWFNTNDIMRRDEHGFFYFVSRADDMFVCGGENIFPGEVEALLNRHPDVQQSLVVGAPDDIKGTVPVAFVVPAPGSAPTEQAIRDFAIEHGPAYLHPRRVIFMDALPLGGTNKIDRRALEIRATELMIEAGRAKRAT